MVEHLLAKQRVTGSNPVFRSSLDGNGLVDEASPFRCEREPRRNFFARFVAKPDLGGLRNDGNRLTAD